MLVLARRFGEKLLIGDDIEVMVVGVQGQTVRLGITAPQQVEVVRPEAKRRPARPAPERHDRQEDRRCA